MLDVHSGFKQPDILTSYEMQVNKSTVLLNNVFRGKNKDYHMSTAKQYFMCVIKMKKHQILMMDGEKRNGMHDINAYR